jgi:luciferase family oxidoreductase group 1
MSSMAPLSVLDISPVVDGGDVRQSLKNSLELARHAERLGYRRFWLAEHHNMPGVASAATSVVIGHVAAGTRSIRVGAGGIMLPNHAPLVIAEQFGTLEALFPGRIDLGLGRAPGSDQLTAQALRRTLVGDVDRFPQDVVELMSYFEPSSPGQSIQAVPGAGLAVPVWILGSSLFGAQLAAALGRPFAFAAHFSSGQMEEAAKLYRARFEPSGQLAKPYLMIGLNVVAAETEAEARRLFTSQQQFFLNLRTGRPGRLPPPVDDIEARFAASGLSDMPGASAAAVVGDHEEVRRGLESFVAKIQPDEIMVTAQIYDHAARVRSFEIAAKARDELARAA